ncbi:Imm70 family immunity protein [Streptococcus acidominimus]|uniref:Immunity protein 70 n=1 Tax=Streptococcus acidominimus TaxID=1326 RepID=A0A4Y9FM30_STRAI|nr:Imm70 family immunity protein [Streptococcus acidominimus]MBF0819827.1 immunity 70 family protein [Streptococcus acidominimus]MBF0838637.1 immunity 70 family protein [Streptococcus acidominimus]MBF0846943.1 immunity 70 family protein [Streptococcus danieliae]TFU29389.1 hypothetical protein E4U01_10275 [Streptococcus acidominimus]
MSVGLMVGYNWWTVGEGSFFNSFFSTVYVRLENNKWGSKYPVIMNRLYWGEVPLEEIEAGIAELLSIQKELENFLPQEIVWDFEDLSATPPWSDNIAPHITNLSQYFITSSGSDLLEVILTSFKFSIEKGKNVIVRSI